VAFHFVVGDRDGLVTRKDSYWKIVEPRVGG
jgi:hypothetical protein